MRHRSAYWNKCLYLAPLCLVMATAHGAVFAPLSQQPTLRAKPARPDNRGGSVATNELPDEGAQIGNLLGSGLTLRLEPLNSTPAPEEVVIIDAFLDNNSASDIDMSRITAALSCDAIPGPMAEGSVVAFSDPLPAQACTPDVANDPLPICISGTCVGPGETCTPGVEECTSGIPEDCIDDDGLPGGPGHCLGTGTCPTVSAPLLNEDRDDYVFACAAATAVLIDSDCAGDSTVFTRAADLDPSPGGSCPLAIGESAYLGTFAFQPSATASGTFTVELHSSSLMIAPGGVLLSFATQNAELSILTPDFCELHGGNTFCDDGLFCSGSEICDPGDPNADQFGCVSGATPCGDDGAFCNGEESCDEANDQCDSSGDPCPDDGEFCNGSESCDEGADLCVSSGDPCARLPDTPLCDEPNNQCVECLLDVDCDDDDVCNGVEQCVGGQCGIVIPAPQCDDGLFCNGMETCDFEVGCVDGPDPDCADAVDCTDDSCNEATDSCDHDPNGVLCADPLFCNGVEICDAELGCLDGPDPCSSPDLCDDDLDACVECSTNEDCDDGLFCSGEETCDAQGVCQPGVPVPDCCKTKEDCNDGNVCNGDETCVANTCQDGMPLNCENGLFCDGVETCDPELGCQAGSAVDCDDSVDCTDDSCDETTDSCDNVPDDAACDNGLFCDGVETCDTLFDCQPSSVPCDPKLETCNEVDDVCEPDVGPDCTTNLDCEDGDDCTADVCNVDVCEFPDRLYGDADNDGVTNIVDVICAARVVFQAATVCGDHEISPDEIDIAPSASCGDDALNIVDVIGHARAAFQGAPDECCGGCLTNEECSDGLVCNGEEICDAQGVCQPGVPVPDCCETTEECDDGNVCNGDETCVANTCQDGMPLNCDDGLFCSGPEICDPALGCQDGPEPNCDDGVSCTDDFCNEATDACVNFPNDNTCSNGLFCDGIEMCNPVSNCQPGPAIDCDDGVNCTADSCNETTGTCDNIPSDALCDDMLFCTGVQTCDAMLGCLDGPDPDCADAVDCTDDSCNEVTDSCDNIPNDAFCDDTLFCTGVETCVGPGGNAEGCAPGTDPCAEGQLCSEPTGCVECLANDDCVDDDPCTKDTCDAQNECQNPPIAGCDYELTIAVPDGCIGTGDLITVQLNMDLGTAPIVGGQFFLDYDPTKLDFAFAEPGDGSGCSPANALCVELLEDVSEATGDIAYDVGALPADPGTVGFATLVTFGFNVIDEDGCDLPGTTIAFDESGPSQNTLAAVGGGEVSPSALNDGVVPITDTTDVLNCPADATFNADAGGDSAQIGWQEIVASSDCEGPLTVMCDNAGTTGGSFSNGTTSVTCETQAGCGVVGSCSFDVTIEPLNNVLADVEVCAAGAIEVVDGNERCISFEFTDSKTGCATLELAEANVTLVGGEGQADVEVAANTYNCGRARDDLHTLGSTDGVMGTTLRSIVQGQYDFQQLVYTADFTGEACLINGNLNSDCVIDVLDFGVFQKGEGGTGDSPCGTPAPHIDLDGDGVIGATDVAILNSNLLTAEAPTCCGANACGSGVAATEGTPNVDGRRSEFVLIDGRRHYLRIIESDYARFGVSRQADVDHDGDIDEDDITALMQLLGN